MTDILDFLKNAILDGERKASSYAKPIKRDLYEKITEKPRMHIIYGIRGGGKTTLLFQRFMDYPKGKRIYLSGDEIEMLGLSLLELFSNFRYVMELKGSGVFIDEITKISKWKDMAKLIYDNYPELNVYISGSSAIELTASKGVLARRAKYHHLLPMSFREFMKIAHGIDLKRFDLHAEDVYTEAMRFDIYFKEAVKEAPSDLVGEYINKSQPFMLEADEEMLMNLMDKIIYEDIAKTHRFERDVLNKFHKLLLVLAVSEKTSYESLSNDLGLSKGVIGEMIRALIDGGIIKAVMPYGSGRVVGRKTWRYFFIVPAIRKMYMKKSGADSSLIAGLTKEDIFLSHIEWVFYLPSGPDFVYKDMFFEVGSKTKGMWQLDNTTSPKKQRFVVYDGLNIAKKDDILKMPFYIYLSHI